LTQPNSAFSVTRDVMALFGMTTVRQLDESIAENNIGQVVRWDVQTLETRNASSGTITRT
jgi:hypothetical protein